MPRVKTVFFSIFNRRKCNEEVYGDRRKRSLRPCDAEKDVWDSIQRLGTAIKNKTQPRQ